MAGSKCVDELLGSSPCRRVGEALREDIARHIGGLFDDHLDPMAFNTSVSQAMDMRCVLARYLMVGFLPVSMILAHAVLSSWQTRHALWREAHDP